MGPLLINDCYNLRAPHYNSAEEDDDKVPVARPPFLGLHNLYVNNLRAQEDFHEAEYSPGTSFSSLFILRAYFFFWSYNVIRPSTDKVREENPVDAFPNRFLVGAIRFFLKIL